MDMEWNTIVNLGWGAVLSLVGWFTRQLWDAIKELKRDLQELRVSIPSTYATRDEIQAAIKELKADHKEDMKEIKDICKQIFDKLDGKADKGPG